MNEFATLLTRAERVLNRLETLLSGDPVAPDWEGAQAFIWRRRHHQTELRPVRHPHRLSLDDLKEIEPQKQRLLENTHQFVLGRHANNVLLTGARGTGKSSLIKAVLNTFAEQGLRLIEVDKSDLIDLPEIITLVEARPERFILFTDDLSFDEGESSYKVLKSVLDGSIAALPDNVLIYATSNRRHLMPEFHDENRSTHHIDGEIHPAEAVEEKTSLSERFGLWISFYPLSQDEYLAICEHWMRHFGLNDQTVLQARSEALQWALSRGSRSGRVAWQFARDIAGRQGMKVTK